MSDFNFEEHCFYYWRLTGQ